MIFLIAHRSHGFRGFFYLTDCVKRVIISLFEAVLRFLAGVTCPGYSLRNSKLKTVLKMNYDKRRTDYEKMLIIKDYCETDISRGEIIEKYKLRGEGSLMEWIRKFVDPNIKRVIDMKGRKIQLPPAPGVESLEEENARLRKELELAQLRAEGLEIMIDLAEKQFKIPIRKKSGAKR